MSKKQQKQQRRLQEEQQLQAQQELKEQSKPSNLVRYQGLIIVLFAFLLYGNTLWNRYAVDDTIVIVKNKLTQQGFEGIPQIMTTDAFYGFFGEDYKFVAGGRYRPLSIVTFAIEYQLMGKKMVPWLSHLINILLYALTCWLVFLVLLELFRSPKTAPYGLTLPFVAALIFAGHPIHTEVVANIKGRDEIMAMLGSMAALYFSLQYVKKEKAIYIVWAAVCFILALLSKENTITFIAVIPLTLFFFTKAKPSKYMELVTPLLILGAIYVALRQHFTPVDLTAKSTEILNDPFMYATLGERFATIAYTFGQYIKLLIFPHPLTYDYYYNQVPIIGWDNIWAIIPFLANLAIGLYGLYALTKKNPVGYAILYYFITISVVSNIVFTVGIAMNERFVFMPSFGVAILFAIVIIGLVNLMSGNKWTYKEVLNPTGVLAILVLILAGYTLKTVTRNMDWKNDFTLFKADVVNSPNSAKVADAYGGELVNAADSTKSPERKMAYLKEAESQLERALQIYPTYQNALVLLGNALYKDSTNKDTTRVLQLYEKTFQRNPNNFEGNYNAAIVYRDLGQYTNAIPLLKRAILVKPDKKESTYLLADMYEKAAIQTTDLNLRAAYIDSALGIYRAMPDKVDNLADMYYKIGADYGKKLGDLNSSVAYISKAIEINPKVELYYEDLGVAYGIKGDYQNSMKANEDGLKINGKYAPFYANIAITYRQLGNEAKFMEYMSKAHELEPKRYQDPAATPPPAKK